MDVSAVTSGPGAPAPAVSDQASAPDVGGITAQSQPAPQAPQKESTALTPAIAKLFGSSNSPEPVQLHVSYRVDGQDIVTVFTDPKTGKEVAQFPPELLLGLAKFFDHQSGVTLDQSA